MRQLTGWTKWMGIGAIAVMTMAGCTPQQEAAVEDDVADAGQVIENTAESAGNTAAGVAENVGEFATVTPNIKAALGGNKAMDGSSIDVNTDVSKNEVHLHGTVKDEAQKKLAEQIARQELQKINEAKESKVMNELTVGAAPSGDTAAANGNAAGGDNAAGGNTAAGGDNAASTDNKTDAPANP